VFPNTSFHENEARNRINLGLYYVNSSDPETAIFVLHKASRMKCCLFLQESPAVAKEDRYSLYTGWSKKTAQS